MQEAEQQSPDAEQKSLFWKSLFCDEYGIEVFGVRMALGASDPELLSRVAGVLPPRSRPIESDTASWRYGLVHDEAGYSVVGACGDGLTSPDPDIATQLLDSIVRATIAQRAQDMIFLHAGAVAHRGRAIVLPGLSMSGKTTLVAELVRAGATYYSDEYAVIDRDGLVHPYAKPLSLRQSGLFTPVESLGGVAGERAVPAGLVVKASYVPGAEWQPSRVPPAEAVVELLPHTIPVHERPVEALTAVTRLTENARVLAGDRGDAAEVAPRLLAELESTLAESPIGALGWEETRYGGRT